MCRLRAKYARAAHKKDMELKDGQVILLGHKGKSIVGKTGKIDIAFKGTSTGYVLLPIGVKVLSAERSLVDGIRGGHRETIKLFTADTKILKGLVRPALKRLGQRIAIVEAADQKLKIYGNDSGLVLAPELSGAIGGNARNPPQAFLEYGLNMRPAGPVAFTSGDRTERTSGSITQSCDIKKLPGILFGHERLAMKSKAMLIVERFTNWLDTIFFS